MSRLELDDRSIETRVTELIGRGLELYAAGDLEGALSYWKHALALDEDSGLALDYVSYLKRHFAMKDEAPAEDAFGPADDEHLVPYGLMTLPPISPEAIDAYLADRDAKGELDDGEGEFAEQVPTRVSSLLADLDQGWSLGTGEFPVQRDRPAAPVPIHDEGLENELASVAEGLEIAESGAIEVPPSEPAPELMTRRKTEPRATALGYELPPPPGPSEPPALDDDPLAELAAGDPMAQTVDVEPVSLGGGEDGPPTLELEAEPATYEIEAEPATYEIEAEPAYEIEAEPATYELEADSAYDFEADSAYDFGADSAYQVELQPPLGDRAGQTPEPAGGGLELDLGKAGGVGAAAGLELEIDDKGNPRPRIEPMDVTISFREPSRRERPAPVHTSRSSMEDQLAELELELGGEAPSGSWQTHQGPALEPLPPPERPAAPAAPPPEADPGDPKAIRESILAELEAGASPGEDPDQRARRRLAGLIDRAERECQRGEYAAAAVAADLALSEGPESAVAQKLIHQRGDALVQAFRRYLGDLAFVPAVALPMHELSFQELDHRAAFLLSRIDGTLSFEDILDVSGMPRLEALRYLCRLRLQGIVEVR